MGNIEDLKNLTTVARNLARARNEYKASPDFLPDAIIRMDNIVEEKLNTGLLEANKAVSGEMDVATSTAILEFYALRREILGLYSTEMSIPQFPEDKE